MDSEKNTEMIYLDHAAATPVIPAAREAMLPYFSQSFFNPSAPYLLAKRVREAYADAKNRLAHTIGAKGADLVITAGATESINLAFTAAQGKALVLATEHHAVLASARQAKNFALIKVKRNGIIDLDDFRAKLADDVDFVSVALANNELGAIQPLAEIAEIIKQKRFERIQNGVSMPLLLHSDASQALSLLDINVARLGVDLLTINAAKCGGPKGIGALYVARGIKLRPIVQGGGQEMGLRSGTENVSGLIGFAAAAEDVKKHLTSFRKKYEKMNQILRNELAQIGKTKVEFEGKEYQLPEPVFLGNPKKQLASFVPVCFFGLDAERLIYLLEAQQIFVSTGAACAASKGEKSHVLAAIGLSDEEIAGSIRISMGSLNTEEQIKKVAQMIRATVEQEYLRIMKRSNISIISQNAEKVNSEDVEGAKNG